MKQKLFVLVACILILSLVLSGCGQTVKVTNVERTNTFGYKGVGEATARSGYDFLLVTVKMKAEDLASSMGDMSLKDGDGNIYPCAGLFSSQFIFEVPESAVDLVLVVKDIGEAPLK